MMTLILIDDAVALTSSSGQHKLASIAAVSGETVLQPKYLFLSSNTAITSQ